MTPSARVLRAQWVAPVSRPPVLGGEVVIEDGRIAAVRRAGSGPLPAGCVVSDLGASVVLPGLVNAHCHLEYTVLRGFLDGAPLFDWLRALVRLKARVPARIWPASALLGAAEAAASGTTCVGDCTDSGAGLAAARDVGLRGVVFQEAFGVDDALDVPAAVTDLDAKARAMQAALPADGRLEVGVSPHAPYTVRPALLRALAAYARERGLATCIHVGEAQADAEWMRAGTGPFAEMYARRGIRWDAPRAGACAYLDGLGALGPCTVLAHGVQASVDDARRAARSGASWVHCPRSNARLGCGVAPLSLLAAEGGRVGLGTDSVVSGGTADMFEEMRAAALLQRASRRDPAALEARRALELATLGGARALGLDARIGTLDVGKEADLIAVSLRGLHAAPSGDPLAALVFGASGRDVTLTMVGGEEVYGRGRVSRVRTGSARRTALAAARRLAADGEGDTAW